MTPIKFPGHNLVIAENQEPYQPLPVYACGDTMGTCLACFELSEEEKEEVLRTGKIWASFWTFNQPFQPMMLSAQAPVFEGGEQPTCSHGTALGKDCASCDFEAGAAQAEQELTQELPKSESSLQ